MALAVFDPTLLLNGLYEMRLSGYDRAGQIMQHAINVVVKGWMKIGHFSLSFNDMMIRAAGLPLSVTRTYVSHGQRWQPGLEKSFGGRRFDGLLDGSPDQAAHRDDHFARRHGVQFPGEVHA